MKLNKKFETELKKLAKKYKIEYFPQCNYCERNIIEGGTGNEYIVTFKYPIYDDKYSKL